MADAAIARLSAARTDAELQAALLHGIAHDDPLEPANEALQAAMRAARRRLARQRRVAALVPPVANASEAPPPLARVASHSQRDALLSQRRLQRSLGADTAGTERLMKDICHDTRCTDCTESREYRAVCLQFILECLSVRMATRLRFDSKNGYAVDSPVTAFMARFVTDPYGVWLDDTHALYGLPAQLQRMLATVVQPTAVDKASRKEAKEYRLHTWSITQMIRSLRSCEAA